nr:hypothetical protein GCM10020092_023180 [Actinoplanes digitatis]
MTDASRSEVMEGTERADADATTAVPRAARRGPISRAAMLNTLRVAVSYPSRYASSRSSPVRYHWCRRLSGVAGGGREHGDQRDQDGVVSGGRS